MATWTFTKAAARCAAAGERGRDAPNMKTPDGYYNLERMLKGLTSKEIGACGTCLDARGMADEALVKGAHPSSMAELTTWTIWADTVITF